MSGVAAPRNMLRFLPLGELSPETVASMRERMLLEGFDLDGARLDECPGCLGSGDTVTVGDEGASWDECGQCGGSGVQLVLRGRIREITCIVSVSEPEASK